MSNLKTIILAAGEGTRMKSKKSKVLHKIFDKSMLNYVIDVAEKTGSKETVVVVGHKSEEVKQVLGNTVKFVTQQEQLGTGHAVMMANQYIGDSGDILILYGDTPLITEETITKVIKFHKQNNNYVTVVSAILQNPTGYGRIIKHNGAFTSIVEERDTTDAQKNINEINTGIYCFKAKALKKSLQKLVNKNVQNEYYLTDTIEILIKDGCRADTFVAEDSQEFLGVNDRIQLHDVTKILQNRINTYHQLNGITFADKNTAYISPQVIIGQDTFIGANVTIEGDTVIGDDCVISNSKIVSCLIQSNVNVESSHIMNSQIESGSSVGPFAYIRPNCKIGQNCKIGDFVEIKNAEIGNNTKISHLSYIGDSQLGSNINIGCGTITVNYDGENKFKTIIEDNCFIGCNSNLIAPVTIKNHAYVAAGSTITNDVPENSLAIARQRQVIKTTWKKNKN